MMRTLIFVSLISLVAASKPAPSQSSPSPSPHHANGKSRGSTTDDVKVPDPTQPPVRDSTTKRSVSTQPPAHDSNTKSSVAVQPPVSDAAKKPSVGNAVGSTTASAKVSVTTQPPMHVSTAEGQAGSTPADAKAVTTLAPTSKPAPCDVHLRATTPAPSPASVAAGEMPWQTEAGIAAASVAGAALIAGGIAGAVEYQDFEGDDKAASVPVTSKPAPKKVASNGSTNFMPKATMNVQTTDAPVPVMVELYDDEQPAANDFASNVIFFGMAGFLLLMGFVFLGLSGIAYCKKRRSNMEPHYEEYEEDEDEESSTDEESPA